MNKSQEKTTSTKRTKRTKNKRLVHHACAHIVASFNNTIIMIADLSGNALAITSAGACGFRSGKNEKGGGGKKGTGYAAGVAANLIIKKVMTNFGVKKIDIFVKGIGQGRDSAIRTFLTQPNLQVDLIADKTTIAHGGVRPRKARRS